MDDVYYAYGKEANNIFGAKYSFVEIKQYK